MGSLLFCELDTMVSEQRKIPPNRYGQTVVLCRELFEDHAARSIEPEDHIPEDGNTEKGRKPFGFQSNHQAGRRLAN